MKQKIMKVGNSLAVTVPSGFVKAVGVRAGQMVKVKKKPETGEMIYRFSGIQQLVIASDILKPPKSRKPKK